MRLENVDFENSSTSRAWYPTLEATQESDQSPPLFFSDVNRTVCFESYSASVGAAREEQKNFIKHNCREEQTHPLTEAGGGFNRADDPWFIQVKKVRQQCNRCLHTNMRFSLAQLYSTFCRLVVYCLFYQPVLLACYILNTCCRFHVVCCRFGHVAMVQTRATVDKCIRVCYSRLFQHQVLQPTPACPFQCSCCF